MTDVAIAKRDPINAFLRQAVTEPSTAEEADAMLLALADSQPEVEHFAEHESYEQVAPPSIAPGPSAIPPLHLAV